MEKITREQLEEMKNVDLNTIDPDTLVDIRDINVNIELSKEERIADFINQIKNPYCYKCGKIIVKVSFEDTDITFEDRMKSYLESL